MPVNPEPYVVCGDFSLMQIMVFQKVKFACIFFYLFIFLGF